MLVVKHLLETDKCPFTEFDSDQEFINFVQTIFTENEDWMNLTEPQDLESCKKYINEYCDNLELITQDLVVDFEQMPPELTAIWDSYDENAEQYKECARLLKECEAIGYTFECYLDAQPYYLRKKQNK